MKRLTIKQLLVIVCGLLVLVVFCMTIYQQNHFNKNTRINNVAVGGLTAKQALKKLQRTSSPVKVYVNGDLVYSQRQALGVFSNGDKEKVVSALHEQYSFSHPLRRKIS